MSPIACLKYILYLTSRIQKWKSQWSKFIACKVQVFVGIVVYVWVASMLWQRWWVQYGTGIVRHPIEGVWHKKNNFPQFTQRCFYTRYPLNKKIKHLLPPKAFTACKHRSSQAGNFKSSVPHALYCKKIVPESPKMGSPNFFLLSVSSFVKLTTMFLRGTLF